jgi:hexosaminidase
MITRILTLTLSAILAITAYATPLIEQASYHIIPLPHQIVDTNEAPFTLNHNTKIIVANNNPDMQRNATFLATYIHQATGYDISITTKATHNNAIILSESLSNTNSEAYTITVNKKTINIAGASAAGVFYGIQTLRKAMPKSQQLQTKILFPSVSITDQPRFAYRGAHLDVCRHFFPVDSVKKYIDMLALHNINRFHWHLSEDQGWRIEIKSHPELTTHGAIRNGTVIGKTGIIDTTPYGEGLYFTQEQARDIVKYAAERYITIIPEIDLPGHMQAALACYPQLGCTGGPYEVRTTWGISDDVLCPGNDDTFRFIEDVLTEIIDIFPSQYIHIGGDECPKIRWKHCPKCQSLIKKLGITANDQHSAEAQLQSYIINHVERFLNSKGRQIIGWDEILEGGLSPNATVMSWRGEAGGIEAAKLNHDVIMTPNTYLYFDYYQTADIDHEPLCIGGYLPLSKVYSYEPMPESLSQQEQQHIIGVQANLWTEFIADYPKVEYMALPRMAALSEIQWCDADHKDYSNFISRLPQLLSTYDDLHYNYARHILNATGDFKPNHATGAIELTLSTINNASIYYTLDGTTPTNKSSQYNGPITIKTSCLIKAIAQHHEKSSAIFSDSINFGKATAKPITLLQPISPKYKYNGAYTLTDGLFGTTNFKSGRWLGFCGNDIEAIIDLLQPTRISSVSINECIDKASWAFAARQLTVETSRDGTTFQQIATADYPQLTPTDPDGVHSRTISFDPTTTRYVKITVQSEHHIPTWHKGNNKPAFLFVDEITIE